MIPKEQTIYLLFIAVLLACTGLIGGTFMIALILGLDYITEQRLIEQLKVKLPIPPKD